MNFGKKWLTRTKVIVYNLSLLFLIVLTGIQAGQSIYKYIQEPTYINSQYIDQKLAAFPSLTFCPDVNEVGQPRMKNVSISSWRGREEDYNAVMFDFWDVFREFYLRYFVWDEATSKTNLRLKIADKSSAVFKKLFTTRTHPKFGVCFTYTPDQWRKDKGAYYFKLTQNLDNLMPIKLFIHEEDHFWDSTFEDMGYRIGENEVVQSQVNFMDVRTLQKIPYNSDTPSCSNERYDDCIETGIYLRLQAEVGCRMPSIRNNLTVCATSKALEAAEAVVGEVIADNSQFCLKPCNFLTVNIGAKNFQMGREGLLYLYFPFRIMKSEEKYLHSVLSVVAEIGGYTGLLLGFSCFHLVKIVVKLMENEVEKTKENMKAFQREFQPKIAFGQNTAYGVN